MFVLTMIFAVLFVQAVWEQPPTPHIQRGKRRFEIARCKGFFTLFHFC